METKYLVVKHSFKALADANAKAAYYIRHGQLCKVNKRNGKYEIVFGTYANKTEALSMVFVLNTKSVKTKIRKEQI